ncbi:MAG: hypothetical protein OXG71_09350 [Rhodospirillales bacterium]|nr:hypothetical protein [Rhodospirillales bacterium]
MSGSRKLIAYSDLVAEIRSVDLEPHGEHLALLLGETSTAEHGPDAACCRWWSPTRRRPDARAGFFRLARSLGRDTKDREAFWIGEFEKVHGAWCAGRKTDG